MLYPFLVCNLLILFDLPSLEVMKGPLGWMTQQLNSLILHPIRIGCGGNPALYHQLEELFSPFAFALHPSSSEHSNIMTFRAILNSMVPVFFLTQISVVEYKITLRLAMNTPLSGFHYHVVSSPHQALSAFERELAGLNHKDSDNLSSDSHEAPVFLAFSPDLRPGDMLVTRFDAGKRFSFTPSPLTLHPPPSLTFIRVS